MKNKEPSLLVKILIYISLPWIIHFPFTILYCLTGTDGGLGFWKEFIIGGRNLGLAIIICTVFLFIGSFFSSGFRIIAPYRGSHHSNMEADIRDANTYKQRGDYQSYSRSVASATKEFVEMTTGNHVDPTNTSKLASSIKYAKASHNATDKARYSAEALSEISNMFNRVGETK